MADIKISLRNTRGHSKMVNDSFPGLFYFAFSKSLIEFSLFYMDLSLGFVQLALTCLCMGKTTPNQSGAPGRVVGWTNYSSQQIRWYIDFVEIFNMSLDLSTVYFPHFNRCRVSFVSSCYSILEYYNLFSGVKLSIRLFCNFFLSLHGAYWYIFHIAERPSKTYLESVSSYLQV